MINIWEIYKVGLEFLINMGQKQDTILMFRRARKLGISYSSSHLILGQDTEHYKTIRSGSPAVLVP